MNNKKKLTKATVTKKANVVACSVCGAASVSLAATVTLPICFAVNAGI